MRGDVAPSREEPARVDAGVDPPLGDLAWPSTKATWPPAESSGAMLTVRAASVIRNGGRESRSVGAWTDPRRPLRSQSTVIGTRDSSGTLGVIVP